MTGSASWTVVTVASLGCYALKLAGLVVPQRWLETRRVRELSPLLPVALLLGLVVVQTLGDGRRLVLDARMVGVVAGLVAIRLRAPFLVVVTIAAAAAATARALT